MKAPRVGVLLASMVLVPACAAGPRHGGTTPAAAGHALPAGAPTTVDGSNFSDALRMLDETAPSAARRPLVDAVARYLAARGLERLDEDDLQGASRTLHLALVHYAPSDVDHGNLPHELDPLARGLLARVSQRGDEGRAIATNRLLLAVTPPDPHARERITVIDQWGETNRAEFLPPWTARGQRAEIYDEAARLVPASDLLERANELYAALRRSAMEGREAAPAQRPTMEDMRQREAGLRGAPMDVAILYLRLGDVETAAQRVAEMQGGGAETGLAGLLRSLAEGEGGADALLDLATRFATLDPDASSALCRRGRRVYPSDVRFAMCLGQAAARDAQFGLASAHLAEAARLRPTDPTVFRAALATSIAWFQAETGSDSPVAGRAAYTRARALVEAWTARFPHEVPPVTPGDLEQQAAQLELGQGDLAAARQHLERATQAEPPSRDAYLTLAEIAWRSHDGATAQSMLSRGLALPPRATEADSQFRPVFLLQQGLVARQSGSTADATTKLTEAEHALSALARSLDDETLGPIQYHRAVALDALGRTSEIRRALDTALAADPDNRDLAAQAVTFCLARGRWRDALELASSARARLPLDRTWQTYFALWSIAAARLGRIDRDEGATSALESIASTADDRSPWTVRLAQRYTGAIDRAALAHFAANSAGHRAEANFYEALLALAHHEPASAAEPLFRDVVQSELLRYFEYAMAWEMLDRGVGNLVSAPPPVSPSASAPATARP